MTERPIGRTEHGDVVFGDFRSEAEIAAGLKARARTALAEVCQIMDEARDAGLVLNFSVGANGYGKYSVQDVTVIKPF